MKLPRLKRPGASHASGTTTTSAHSDAVTNATSREVRPVSTICRGRQYATHATALRGKAKAERKNCDS